MKAVILSDIHLHTWAYGGVPGPDGLNSRLAGQKAALENVLRYIYDNDIRHVYFGGDLFHTPGNIPTQALHVAADFFRKLDDFKCGYHAVVGNHDMATRSAAVTGLDFMEPWRVARPGIMSQWYQQGEAFDWNTMGMGYTDKKDEVKRFLERAEKAGGRVLLMHQGVSGLPMASGVVLDECLTADMIPENCIAFTGHYHFHKIVTPKLIMIGNLTPLNWNDVDQAKGFLSYDIETNDVEFIEQIGAPKFLSYNYEEPHENIGGNFLRYSSEVEMREVSKIREGLMSEGALGVEFPHIKEVEKLHAIPKTFDLNSTLESYYETIDEPRRKEVGLEVQQENYKSPL